MTLDVLGMVLGRFAVVAVAFMIAAAMFDTVVSQVEQPVARLIAKHGARSGLRILVRLRCYQTNALRRWAAWRVGVQVAAEVLVACLPAIPVLLLLSVPMVQSLSDRSTVLQGVVYFLLIGSAAYIVGPLGLRRALGRLGERPVAADSWPPAIPHIDGSTTSGSFWKASLRTYWYYLHGVMVRLSLLGVMLTTLGTPQIVRGGVGEEAAATGYFVILLLFLMNAETLLAGFPWWIDHRLRAVALIAAFLDGPPVKKHSALLGNDPFGKVRDKPIGSKDTTIKPARDRLVPVVAAIERHARWLHRAQRLNLRHPVAHVLELEAAHLRSYLAEPRSLDDVLPDDVRQSLRRASSVLVGGTPEFLKATATELERYEEQVEFLSRRSPWTQRFSGALDITGKAFWLAVTMATAFALSYLLITGQTTPAEAIEGIVGLVKP